MGVYKRGKTWYISFPRCGKRIREAMGANKAAAEAVLNRKKLAIRAGEYADPADRPLISFFEACDDYLNRSAHLKGKDTLVSVVKILKGYFGEKDIGDLTEKDVDDFILSRRDAPTRHKKKRAGASINREVNVLPAMLRSAMKQGWLEKNPASCPRKFTEKQRLRYLTREEAGRLLDEALASRSKDTHLAILMALDTGMRQGEIFNLRWEDVNFKSEQIWVRETKNRSPRHIPMTGRVRDALAKRPRRIGNDYIFWGRVKENRDHAGMRESFVNLLQRAGIKDFTFHDLRHSFSSHLAMAGVPLHTIGQLLGHKTPKMTMRYAHLSPEYLKGAITYLPAWQSGTKEPQVGRGEG